MILLPKNQLNNLHKPEDHNQDVLKTKLSKMALTPLLSQVDAMMLNVLKTKLK